MNNVKPIITILLKNIESIIWIKWLIIIKVMIHFSSFNV